LYTGGETTVRGFTQNELGPLIYVTETDLDTAFIRTLSTDSLNSTLQGLRMRTIPTGGNAVAVGNLELRLPGPFLRTLQTILFVDVGALSTEGFGTIGEKQARWTPGIAVKYFSPVGPMQFNLGYNKYDYVSGPVYLDQGPGSVNLKCLSLTEGGVCQPAKAKASKTTFWKRLTFTIAFPPDF
jgi:outer membrane protein assembly factor BamA